MSNIKCNYCGLVNDTADGMNCRRCGTNYDLNAPPFKLQDQTEQTQQQLQLYQPPYQNSYQQIQPIQPPYPQYQHPLPNQPFQRNPKAVSGYEALLWALCCFPIGFARFNQIGKFFVWLAIVIVSGGIGLIPMYIDYAMSFGAQKDRPLKPWEFFPR